MLVVFPFDHSTCVKLFMNHLMHVSWKHPTKFLLYHSKGITDQVRFSNQASLNFAFAELLLPCSCWCLSLAITDRRIFLCSPIWRVTWTAHFSIITTSFRSFCGAALSITTCVSSHFAQSSVLHHAVEYSTSCAVDAQSFCQDALAAALHSCCNSLVWVGGWLWFSPSIELWIWSVKPSEALAPKRSAD